VKSPFLPLSRRDLLQLSGLGIGGLALTCMLEAESTPKRGLDLRPRPGQFPSKIRSVIQLVQNGGPSHMDLFDPKPELTKRDGQPHSVKVEMFQPGSEANQLMGSPFEFRKHGQCGMELSEALTHTPSIADDICLVRSMHSEHNNHLEALVMFQTCKIFPGRPTLGAWISYGLGTENQNLPAYIVLRDPEGYNTSGSLLWDNGWLPAVYRGTEFSSEGAPVLNLRPAEQMPAGVERNNLKFLARMNEEQRLKYPDETDLEARIRNYELAARMQLSAGGVVDLSKESESTKKLYGLDNPIAASYGTRCLMARRLVEAGVRFVQIFPPIKPSIQPWDSHGNIKTELPDICARTEPGATALVKDLKSRGLLDSTLVIWAGEFGRLPVSQNGKGRDHNRNAFSLWLAGGGFKAGYVHGGTDDVGYKAVDKPVSVPDLHATILQQLGIDHRRLIYNHQGRPETMTDFQVTGANVVAGLLQSPANA
jgi:hypothetical protein